MSKELLWQSDNMDGTYKNPIIYADYSDPDVIRVGDQFYMTASSFNYTPGLPILVSEDLIHWELKNYAVKNLAFEQYDKPAHSKGIWAPAIRYHNHKYWISYGMPDEGIFLTWTEDPLGLWSDPILLLEGKGYIDPCPFWDEDGKAYIVHGYAKSRIGFKSYLGLFEMTPDGSKVISDDRFIYDGTMTQPTIEGPKIYKREGYYYIFAPAGGVKYGWQTVLRSKHIGGPYEERIVMKQGDSSTNGPHQGALIDTPSGEEWFVHFQDCGFYGRIAHLQPVIWKDQWPMIGVNPNEEGCGEPCLCHEKPKDLPTCEPTYLVGSDDFDGKDLGLQWQWLGNHYDRFYSLEERKGYLRLKSVNIPGDSGPILWNAPNVLTQKFICPFFESIIKMDFEGLQDKEQAGCIVIGGQYVYIGIRKIEGVNKLIYIESETIGDDDCKIENLLLEKSLDPLISSIKFKIVLNNDGGRPLIKTYYACEDENYISTGYTFEPSDHTWVGAKLGLFSVALEEKDQMGHADFDYIKVDALKV